MAKRKDSQNSLFSGKINVLQDNRSLHSTKNTDLQHVLPPPSPLKKKKTKLKIKVCSNLKTIKIDPKTNMKGLPAVSKS